MSVSVVATFLFRTDVPAGLAAIFGSFQATCVDLIPESSRRDIFSALVCGARLPHSPFKTDLLATGLFHLLVASGTHLAVLEGVLRKALGPKRESLILGLLLLYALMTGLCPPFLRVLCAWSFSLLNGRFQLNWSRLQCLTLAGFFTLFLCQDLRDLLSLALSWIAGLAVFLTESPRTQKTCQKTWREKGLFQILLYFLMVPALLPLSVPHPISILWNLLLAPLFTLLLFPVGLFAVLTRFTLLPEMILDGMIWITHQAAQMTPQGWVRTTLPEIAVWIYLFALSLTAHIVDRRRREVKC